VFNHVSEIPIERWPKHHRTLFDTREWFAASRWPGESTQYVLSGEALLPFRVVRPGEWVNADANVLCGGFKYLPHGTLKDGDRIYPHGIVMGPGYHTDPASCVEDTEHVVQHLEQLCDYPIAFLYVYPGSVLSRVLARRPYTAGMITASAWLPLPGTQFEDYLRSFNANRRRSAMKEMKVFQSAGVQVRVYAGTSAIAHLPTFARLSGEVQRRHGNQPNDSDTIRQLHQFVDIFGDRALFFFGVADGSPIAATMAVTCHDMILARDVGLEYGELARDAMAYFNLAYYEIIRYAYENGYRMVASGISAFGVKALRGFQLVPLLAYISRYVPWQRSLAATDRELRARLGKWLVTKPFEWSCGTSQRVVDRS
jgi:hypothetical protein